MGMTGTGIARFIIANRLFYQQMPAIVVVMVHAAFTVDPDNLVGFLSGREHGSKIFVTGDAIRITVVGRIVCNRGIDQVIFVVVHVNIIDPRHGIDDIQRALKSCSVIFEHRTV